MECTSYICCLIIRFSHQFNPYIRSKTLKNQVSSFCFFYVIWSDKPGSAYTCCMNYVPYCLLTDMEQASINASLFVWWDRWLSCSFMLLRVVLQAACTSTLRSAGPWLLLIKHLVRWTFSFSLLLLQWRLYWYRREGTLLVYCEWWWLTPSSLRSSGIRAGEGTLSA